MRILQIVHGYPPDECGGVELLTSWLARSLSEMGHQVAILARRAAAGSNDGVVEYEDSSGIEIARVVSNCVGLPFRDHYSSHQFDSLFATHLRCFDPDVLHVQHTAGLSAQVFQIAASSGYPVTAALHDAYYVCARVHLVDAQGKPCAGPDGGRRCQPCLEHWAGAEPEHRLNYLRQMLGLPQKLLVPSRWLAELYRTNFPEIGQKLVIEPPGIPSFDPLPATRPQHPLRLVAFGNLIPEKGFHLIAQALSHLPPQTAKCRVFGGEVERARDYATELRSMGSESFALLPAVPYEDVSKVLAEADAVVIPSICGESFSLVARDAFQAEVPVVAARSGALLEALEGGQSGLLFEAGDARSLADAIEKLAEPATFRRFASSSVPVRKIGEYAERLLTLWQDLVRPRPAFFSYGDYDARMRNEEEMKKRLEPYLKFFKGRCRVVDLAAGNGGFLEMLREEGIDGVGVDRSPAAVREMRERGLEAIEADAVDAIASLRGCDGVFVSHFLEHLSFAEVERLIAGIAYILPVAGIAVFVLPNPESIRMHLFGFWRDPEHVRFYHPDLVDAVCAHHRLARIFSSVEDKPFHVKTPELVLPHAGDDIENMHAQLSTTGAYAGDVPPSFLGPPEKAGRERSTDRWYARNPLRRAASLAFSELCSALRLVQVNSLHKMDDKLHHELEELRYQLDRVSRAGEERDFALFAAAGRAVEEAVRLVGARDRQLQEAIVEFNQRINVLGEALNRMWCWVDDAGLVYQKAGRLRVAYE